MNSRIKSTFAAVFAFSAIALSLYFVFGQNTSAHLLTVNSQNTLSNELESADKAVLSEDFGNLPLYFSVNKGQTDKDVKYYSVGSRHGLFLTGSGPVLRLVSNVATNAGFDGETAPESTTNIISDQFKLGFSGANFSKSPVGEDEMAGKANYLIGNDSSKWQTNVATYSKVRYENVYPGIDAVFHGTQRELEYDFVVAPNANSDRILLEFKGAQDVEISEKGELLIKLQNGVIAQRKPVAFQNINGQKQIVTVEFVKKGEKKIAFNVGNYDRNHELTIDPIIVFSTYFGGSSTEFASSVKTDAQGNVYLTGATASTNFPTLNAIQPTLAGSGNLDAFVTKLNPAGNGIVFSTYLGGAFEDYGNSIAVDSAGSIFVSGRTYSLNFPTANARQPLNAGGADGFVAKLNAQGSALLFSTYHGGAGFDEISSSTIDSNGDPVLVGRTESGDFPSVNPLQPQFAGTSFFRSSNFGTDWTIGSVSPNAYQISGFAINPTSPNIVYAATNTGVFKSIDGGTTWSGAGQAELNTPVSKIAVARSNTNIIYAISNGSAFKSTNAGVNWTNMQGSLFSLFSAVAVDPNNPDVAYISGSSGRVFKTIDGGVNWTDFSIVGVSSFVYSIVIDPVNTQILYVGSSQRIYKSVSGGGNWTALANGLPFSSTYWDMLIDPSSNTIYAASQNGLYKSTDAGTNWTQMTATNLVAVRSVAQDPNSFANLFAATSFGAFFRSIDGGATWAQTGTGLTGNVLYAVAGTSNSVLLGGYRGTDAFVSRLNGAGNALSFSTFFGGNLNDSATGVRIGADNKIAFVGTTSSTNFPVVNAIQPSFGGITDAFAAKLNVGNGSVAFSTFLGGTSNDSATAVAVDDQNSIYLSGTTVSADFPVMNAFQPICGSCASFGNDAFVTKINAAGSGLVYSSFLGGSSNESGIGIAVDSQRQAVIVGSTFSNNFPVLDAFQGTIAGGSDGFVSLIKADGTNFIYSSYIGGTGTDTVTSVAMAPEGNPVIIGQTTSFNFPVVSPIQTTIGGGQDAFVAKVGNAADLEIVKSDERDPVMVNNPLVYNLRVKNYGPSIATSVVATDNIPSGVSFVSATSTIGSCTQNNSIVTCNLGSLALNAQADIRIVLTPSQAATIGSVATVTSPVPDPVGLNNSDVEQTVISASPSIAGRVASANGQGASDVAISVQGFQARTVQTDSSGNYMVPELPIAGNYTVRPVKQGFYFSPRSRSYASLTQDETADFTINSCVYTLSQTSATVSAAGGQQIIQLTTNDPFCAWTATSNVPWATVTSGGSGFGNGTVKVLIQNSSSQRVGTITIAGQTFTITQEGCIITLTPFQQSFGQAGGNGTIQVKTSQSFCQWSATTSDSWISIPGGSGTGNGTLNYSVASTTKPRGGRIVIGGQNFSIWQEFGYCPTPGFAAPFEPTVNSESKDIVIANFNGDLNLDLVSVDMPSGQSGTYSVYSGYGDGTFNRNSISTTIGQLSTLAVGDFNNDSNQDIAVIGSGGIAIYNGSGLGPFTLFGTFSSPTSTNSKVRAEDFNHDGNLDLIITVTNQLYVLNGNGNGTFTQGFARNVTGRFSYSYDFGDLNGDGYTDVVYGQEEDFNIPRLYYFFGTSTGTFTEGGTVSLGDLTPFTLKVADLNGDGKADVISNGYLGSQVRVYLWNSGSTGFRPPINVFAEPFNAYTFAVADVDNDGKPDIISGSNQGFPKRINIMRGNGNGTFRLPIGSASVAEINNFAFADFNRDGRIDIAFAKKTNQMAAQVNVCNPALAERSRATRFDFDGNGKADFAVIRPSNNSWYVHNNSDQSWNSMQFGSNGDIPVAADFDGDGRTDHAVFRPTDGNWYRVKSSDGSTAIERWGQNGDVPVPADFDGDDRADLAVFRPSENAWYWISSLNGQVNTIRFGTEGDVPVSADYDGDGKADLAVFRPSNGIWYVSNSSNGEFRAFHFGIDGDKAVPADYDGDGRTDFAVFRPSNSTWYLTKSASNESYASKFGTDGDIPSAADYDGDGLADFAVFRKGIWYVQNSASGNVISFGFGKLADMPVPSIYVR